MIRDVTLTAGSSAREAKRAVSGVGLRIKCKKVNVESITYGLSLLIK
jgi:hypothetical protein